MGLFSFFKRAPSDGHGARVRRAVPPQDPATLELLRTRARRRLIGAAVLVAVAVIAVPLALETNSRPSGEWTGEVAFTTMNGREAGGDAPVRVAQAPSARETSAASAVAEAPASSVRRVEPPRKESSPKVEPPKAVAKVIPPERKPDAEVKAAAAAKANVSPTGRYVIQVGAYAKMESVDEMRARIQKLGLRSVYNTTETPQGQRIRVRLGPFSSREAADQALAKLKAGGVGASVMTWEASR